MQVDKAKRNEAARKRYALNADYREKEKARAMAQRQTPEFLAWFNSPEGKSAHRARKEKYRRQAGAPTRQEIAAKSQIRKAEMEKARLQRIFDRQAFIDSFVGPPRASSVLSKADYFRHRYATDPDFMCHELDRAQQWKVKTRPGYAGSNIKWKEMPQTVKQVKQLIHNISKQIKEQSHA